MMTDKHTPGPWRVDDNYVLCLYDGRPNNICRMLGRGDETEANARLIAAAPDMAERIERLEAVNADLLEACKRTRQGYMNLIEVGALPHKGWDEQTREYIAELDELIAKAEGES